MKLRRLHSLPSQRASGFQYPADSHLHTSTKRTPHISMERSSMSVKLLDATDWSGKAFSGHWKLLDGGHLDVIEPATGQPIGGVSKATPGDIRFACASAQQAQPG